MRTTTWQSVARGLGAMALVLLACSLAACGSSEAGAAGDERESARAPSSAGDVWEIDRPADRAGAQAAVLAYVHGLHVLVLDGNTVFSGTTRLKGERDAEGATVFTLAGGLTASLVPAADGMELRFSTGERVPMRKRGEP